MDWDKRYQQGDIPWDLGKPHPLWKDFLQSENISGAVGVPACGLGHDVYAAAIAGYEAWGWDISSTAIVWAQEHYVHKRAHFERRDMFHLHADWEGKFAVVWEWNCFCIFSPEQRKSYLRMLLHILKPNGVLAGVFRIKGKDADPSDEAQTTPPWWVTEGELDGLLSPFFRLVTSKRLEEEENGHLSWRKYRCCI
jgi:SAM-dependent methyltransferase